MDSRIWAAAPYDDPVVSIEPGHPEAETTLEIPSPPVVA
jgi:hypothetical protein